MKLISGGLRTCHCKIFHFTTDHQDEVSCKRTLIVIAWFTIYFVPIYYILLSISTSFWRFYGWSLDGKRSRCHFSNLPKDGTSKMRSQVCWYTVSRFLWKRKKNNFTLLVNIGPIAITINARFLEHFVFSHFFLWFL